MKSIIIGMYIAAAAFSSVGPSCVSAAASEPAKETTKRKTRARRLRRKNVVNVDSTNEAEQNINNKHRVLNRSDDSDEMTNGNDGNRQLVEAGTISAINISEMKNAESFASVNISELKNEHIVDGGDLEALFAMTQTETEPQSEFAETLDDEESDVFFMMKNILPNGRVHKDDMEYSMPINPTDKPKPTKKPKPVPPTPAPFGGPTPAPFTGPTRNPTQEPTFRPVVGPTRRPTPRPTPYPTPRPTPRPTNPPTPLPTRAPNPGPNPLPSGGTVCGDLTPAERESLISAQVATYSGNRVNQPGTAQNIALQWLIDEDPLQVCPEDFLDVQQRYILAVLYFATGGDQWDNCNALSAASQSPCVGGEDQRFLSSSDVCFWFGISCNRLRVSGISIDENNLRGELPEEIGYLEQIEDLDFDGELEEGLNFLTGTIPSTFGLLERLVTLDLDSNELTGTIPEEIFDSERLTIMDLDSNELEGTLSAGFANLAELQILFLDNNAFSGTLPAEMGEMERLRFLRLDRNELSGSIPDEWATMERLRVMFLNNNAGITGTIPSYLGNFLDMQQLSLFDTGISGAVPSTLGQLTGLVNLFLHFTDLTGTMPQEICDLRTSGALNFLTADCAGNNPKLQCSQPDCCTVCF